MRADKIDPQAKEMAERLDRIPTPHSRLGLKLFRPLMRMMMWVQNRDVPSVGATVDRTIPGPGGPLDVRLYVPDSEGPFPTVVYFHGGGYTMGGIESSDWLCRHLTRESGCAFLSVDYRLAPEHPYPAPVEDAYAAVEWAAANPDAVEGNGQVAVAGDSAGGRLAAVAALMARDRGGPDIDYQALIYPGVGLEYDQESVIENAGIVLDEDDLRFSRDCFYGGEARPDDPYANPTNAEDLSGVPPATVITAGFDPLRDGGTAYADQLKADGVSTHHVNFEDMAHGFMLMRDADRTHEAIATIADDLAEALDSNSTA